MVALLHPFSGSEAKAKEPINEDLMDKKYKENIEDLATQIGSSTGGGGGGGLEALALQNSNEKNGIISVLPNSTSIVQPFSSSSNLQIWLRKIYDASADTTTMYLDHGLDTELETHQDFETIGDFTAGANSPTLAADTTNFIEGTQAIKMTKASLNGSIDMTDVVNIGLLDRMLRVSFYPDTLSNVVQAYVKLETSVGNDVSYYFPVANMTATTWHNFTVDLNKTADASNGTFERSTITKIYYGFTTNSAQTVNVSWDLCRLLSDKSLLAEGYTLELPIQDNDHQEILSIVSNDVLDTSKFTLAVSAVNDYPFGLSKANLEVAYFSTQTGSINIDDKNQKHKSTASGEAAKSAITTEILYPVSTVSNATLETFTRFYSEDIFKVTDFPTTTTIEIESSTDKSGYFLNDDYFFLFKKQRVGYKNQSFKGTDGSNFQYLQLSTDASYSSTTITLTHGGDNSVGTDDSNYYVVRAEVIKKYIAGAKNANTITTMEPTEFLPLDDSIPYFIGISDHWKMDESTGSLSNSKGLTDLLRIGSPSSINGKFDKAVSGFVSNTAYFRNYVPSLSMDMGGTQAFVVECWVKFKNISGGGSQFLFVNNETNAYSASIGCILIEQTSSSLRFGDNQTYSTYDTSSLEDGRWHYMVCIANGASTSGTTKWIYVDGISVGSIQNTASSYANANGYISIGADSNANRNYQGDIDDIVFWANTTMSSKQILQRYANGIGRRYGNHVGYSAKYTATNISSVEKITVFDQLTRNDTTNQNPSNIESNSLIY